ncbi:MAG: hypothetical protein ACK4SM_05965 [Aquificaceae bacterium]
MEKDKRVSYYKELKGLILSLKDVFFLSPREIWFLKFLEESGYPLDLVADGIKKFYTSLPPEKRSKVPVFFAFKEIKRFYEAFLHKKAREIKIDWRKKFFNKIEEVKKYLPKDYTLRMPQNEKEAEKILNKIEDLVAKNLWNSLTDESKHIIIKKYIQFKDNKQIFKLMIKNEVLKMWNIKTLSLYVD